MIKDDSAYFLNPSSVETEHKEDFPHYAYLRLFLNEKVGLYLDETKNYLFESRLIPILRKYKFESTAELAESLRTSTNTVLEKEVMEAMLTYETSFFRDQKPFEFLETRILPALLENQENKARINILCTGCSSGQEPYSVAMIMRNNSKLLQERPVSITATDCSTSILEKAMKGQYTQFEVQRGLPISYLLKYFRQENSAWIISDYVKELITFKQHNLISAEPEKIKYDVIFCRNVLLYFDLESKKKVVDYLCNILKPTGYLILGCSETILGHNSDLKPVENFPGIYQHLPR